MASDHHLSIGEIRLRIVMIDRQEETIGRRLNTRRLEYATVKRFFVDELENRAADIPKGGSVGDQWSAIKNAFIAIGENNMGELRIQRKQWITDGTWRKIEERRNATAAIEQAKTRGAKTVARQRHSALEKEVKRSCRRDKRALADSLADEGRKDVNTGDIRLLYDASRRLSETKMNITMPVIHLDRQYLRHIVLDA